MKTWFWRCGVVAFILPCVCAFAERTPITVSGLRCEYRVNPMGIDVSRPRLSWILTSDRRGQAQGAYQIMAASSEEKLTPDRADLWDSGKIQSPQSIQIAYGPKPLNSSMRCYWKVRIWNADGSVSAWSPTAWWEMALLSRRDWRGCWINDGKANPENEQDFYSDDPVPLFRKVFTVDRKVKKARLYITAAGYYAASINGNTVGDHVLDPGWTDFSKRILYSTYDITGHLQKGDNCFGVALGNGWYNPLPLRMWGQRNIRNTLPTGRPCFLAQLNIEYADGTSTSVVSDDTWKVHDGPILRNSIFLGEVYDARKEIDGWDRPGLDDSAWRSAAKAPAPGGTLQARFQPPIRKTAVIKTVAVTEPEPGVFIYDMGRNFSGWLRMTVNVPRGTEIKLRFGELLHNDGRLNPMTSVCGQIKGRRKSGESVGGPGAPEIAWQGDTYIAKGGGPESYVPRFTWHAFRYVEIRGCPGKLPLDAIEGYRLNSDIRPVGTFNCSNEMFNRIQEMVEWTFLSNIFSVQSDCPHRERFSYGGDLAVTSEAFMTNYDMATFYAKAVRDWHDAARDDGMLTDTAPFVGIQYCGVAWAMAHPLLLAQLHRYYGDKRLIEEQYDTAQKWFDLVISRNPDHIIKRGLSDHEGLHKAPAPAMVTPLYYQCANIMTRLATILDKDRDAQRYARLAEQIKQAYLEKFLAKGQGVFEPGSQASQSFALYCGLCPADEKDAAVKYLVDDIVGLHKGHLSTGIFGTKYMLDVLSTQGRADIAYTVVNQRDYPGWGNMLEKGATTLWEHWRFSDNTFSHNHPMFGSVSEWFYKHAAGIAVDPEAVGADKFIISPKLTDRLDWARATYDSVRGPVVCDWRKKKGRFFLNIALPVGATAKVCIPVDDSAGVLEGNTPAAQVAHVRFVRRKNGLAVYHVDSGRYAFSSVYRDAKQ